VLLSIWTRYETYLWFSVWDDLHHAYVVHCIKNYFRKGMSLS
jgi:hypothetical protein